MNLPRVTVVSSLGVSRVRSPNESDPYQPSLGVLTLAAHLRESFPVSVVDLDYLWRHSPPEPAEFQSEAVEAIRATSPDVVGFSSISGSYPLTIRLAEQSSRILPGVTIIFGGPQATVTDVATMNAFPFVDLILRGEADDTLPALIAAIAADSAVVSIPGLTFRERGRIRRNPAASAILDLDRLPLPAFDLVPSVEQLAALPLELGRGCPFSCTFCSTNDFFRRRFRLKSAAHVLAEMHSLHQEWGFDTFVLVHDMFTVDRRRVVAFCETLIAAGSPYRWSCSARSDSVDAELLHLMRKAGCCDIFFGMETGSRRMQRVIDKDLNLNQALDVLREADLLGIHTDASLIVGYPQETRGDLRDTVNFFGNAMLIPWVDPQLHILSPLAATPITDEYRDQLTLDENWEQISENGTLQVPVDRLLIAAHPEIFPNFYAFPFYTCRDMLRRLRDFLFYGLARCGGLMRALYLSAGDLLAVFEEWDKAFSQQPTEWFGDPEFVPTLISFSRANYSASPSVLATASFYERAHRSFARRADVACASEPYITLAANAALVESDCDINAVLNSLARGEQPEPEALTSPVTVGIRLIANNRAEILRFPPVTLNLLRHAARASTVAAIERDFEQRNFGVPGFSVQRVVREGIDYLEAGGFLRRVLPAREEAFEATALRAAARTAGGA